MKKWHLCCCLLLLNQSVFAQTSYDHGLYSSLTLGRGYNHFSRANFIATESGGGRDKTIAARLALGFNIDKYIGVEVGGRYFQERKFKNLSAANWTGLVNEQAYDIQTLIRWPFGDGFNFIAKFGPAYVEAKQSLQGDASGGDKADEKNIDSWQPSYGLGVSMDLNDYPGVSFVFNYSVITGNNDKDLPESQLYVAGLIFHF